MAETFDVRTSFVSFVDHLPSDIMRKLWLIQSLNMTYETHRHELDVLLVQLKSNGTTQTQREKLKRRVLQISTELTRLRCEVSAESKSIATTIKIAKMQLTSQHEQLEHDHKMHENEIEMKETLLKHAQRTNKRVSSTNTQKRITLKLNIQELTTAISTPVKRKRGRPKAGETEEIMKKQEALKKELQRLRLLMVEEEAKSAARATVDSSMSVHDDSNIISESNTTTEDNDVYCTCRGPSFGQMVACDNEKCPYEWFHYSCVGLRSAPKGKWYCPSCVESDKPQQERKSRRRR